MTIDARIPLMGNTQEVFDSVNQQSNKLAELSLANRQENRMQKTSNIQNQLSEQELVQKKFEEAPAREKARAQSVAIAAAHLGTYLDSGDTEGARNFLKTRRQELQRRQAHGEAVDTRETDAALKALDSDPEMLKKQVDNSRKLGQMLGILDKGTNSDYTLGQGQNRYDASGNIIAKGPPKTGPMVEVTDPETGETKLVPQSQKPMPASASKSMLENTQNLRKAKQAAALVEGKTLSGAGGEMQGDTAATGFKGYLPNAVLQRTDPSGTSTRAAIADLGSMVIHDRSGAAVTASEYPRLAPFIPKETDDQDTVKKKLANFVSVYQQIVDDSSEFYGEQGYKVPSLNTDVKTVEKGGKTPWQSGQQPAAEETKTINGVTYKKINGKWHQ